MFGLAACQKHVALGLRVPPVRRPEDAQDVADKGRLHDLQLTAQHKLIETVLADGSQHRVTGSPVSEFTHTDQTMLNQTLQPVEDFAGSSFARQRTDDCFSRFDRPTTLKDTQDTEEPLLFGRE